MHNPAELDDLIGRLPQSTLEVLSLVRQLEHQAQHEQAISLLKRAIDAHPQGSLQIALGSLYMKLERHKDALVHLVEVLRESPDHHPTILLVAECLIHCDELERAQNMLRQAERAGAPQPRLQNLRKVLLHKKMGDLPSLNAVKPKHDPLAPSHSALMQNPLTSRRQDHDDAPTYTMERPDFSAKPKPRAQRAQAQDQEEDRTIVTDLPNFDDFIPPPELGRPGPLLSEDTIDEQVAPPRHALPKLARPEPPPGFMPTQLDQEEDEPTKAFESPYARARQTTHDPFGQDELAGPSWADAESSEGFWTSSTSADVPMLPGLQSNAAGAQPQPKLIPRAEYPPPQAAPAPHPIPADMQDEPQGSPHDDDIFGIEDPEEVRRRLFGPPQQIGGLPPSPPKPARGRANAPQAQGQSAPTPQGPPPSPPRQPQAATAHEDLALDLPQAQSAPPRRPAAALTRKHANLADETSERPSSAIKRLGQAAIILAILAIGAAYVTMYMADSGVAGRINADITSAQRALEDDTYKGYTEAIQAFERATKQESFLGRDWDERLAKGLPSLPGLSAQRARRQAAGLAARYSAMTEHRFSALDEHNSTALIQNAQASLSAEHPDVLLAKLYQELLTNPVESVTRAEGASLKYPEDRDLLGAHVLALMQLGQYERAHERAAPLRKAAMPAARQRLIAAMASEQVYKLQEARQLYQKIIDADHPKHIEALAALAALPAEEQTIGQGPGALKGLIERAGELAPGQRALIYRRLSDIELARAQEPQALIALTKAAAATPSRFDWQLPLIDLYIRTADYKQAKHLIDQAIGLRQLEPVMRVRQARIARLQGEYEEALKLLAQISDRLPQRHMEEARVHMERRQWAQAIKAAKAAQELDNTQSAPQVLAILSEQQQAGERSEQVSAELKKLLERFDSSAPIIIAAARSDLLEAQRASTPKQRQDLIASAQKRLVTASRLSPLDAQVELLQCQVEAARGKLMDALSRCEQAHKLAPSSPPIILQLADVQLQLQKQMIARELLMETRTRLPQHVEVSLMLARTATIMGFYDDAQQELDRWLNDPLATRADYKTAQGLLAFHKADLDAALGYLKQATELETKPTPTQIEAQIFLAYTQVRFGELKLAEKPLRAHLDHPRFGGYAWLALGELRRRQRRFQDAEENLSKAISLLKDSSSPDWMIGEAYIQRALAWQDKYGWDNPRVAQHLNAALEHSADRSVELHYLLGLRQLKLRRPDLNAAIPHLEQALKLQPHHCMSLRSLDYIYTKLRQSKQADEIAKTLKAHCS